MPGAYAEHTELGTYPVAFPYIQRLAETGEFLSVKAVIECSLGSVVGFLCRLFDSGIFHLDAEVKIFVAVNLD